MKIKFYKYQGTGNDFIVVDNRKKILENLSQSKINQLCSRKTGIGADGFISLEKDDTTDFKMTYYNSDGYESSMCGNGGRCIAKFAQDIGLIKNQTFFKAIDGIHKAVFLNDKVRLKMNDVSVIKKIDDYFFLNTGSPHVVCFIDNLDIKFIPFARKIRYSEQFSKKGVNVNIIMKEHNKINIRSYERGIEDETLSCGTGATACAIASHFSKKITGEKIQINTKGGVLTIEFECNNLNYTNIWLTGFVKLVYIGEFYI